MKVFGWIVFGLATTAVLLWAVGQWRWSAKTQALLQRLEAARIPAPLERFDPRELDGLPEPVARHLRQALPPGTPIIRAADVMHVGTFNLETSVGRARVCGLRVVWQGATTRRGGPRKEEQHREARNPCNRVRSGPTQWVSLIAGTNASTHAALREPRSGQLRFLGST